MKVSIITQVFKNEGTQADALDFTNDKGETCTMRMTKLSGVSSAKLSKGTYVSDGRNLWFLSCASAILDEPGLSKEELDAYLKSNTVLKVDFVEQSGAEGTLNLTLRIVE